ncbi:MAG: DUF202 domain-containing protein [Cyanobacteria bacterium P01_F01_bin.86]
MTASHSSPPPKPKTELAKERNRLAADRTILSWIRSGLVLISLGFGIDQAVNLLHAQVGDAINPMRLSHVLGLLFVGLGIYAIMAAVVDYRGELYRLDQPAYVYTPRYRLGETIAIALMAIAVLCFVSIGIRVIA